MQEPIFLDGGGEMAERVRAYDWSCTSLGPIDQWPGSLCTTLNILLHSSFPMFLFWGDDLICFYNDAFRPSLGIDGKHPMVGKKGRDGWADIWNTVGKLLEDVRTTGKPVQFEDMPLSFYRNGRMEDSYWTFSYSPIFGDRAAVTGIFVTCVETTKSVYTLQQLAESETRFRTMAEGSDTFIAVADEHGNATYFNKAWTALTDRPMEALLNLGWADLIHPDDRDAFVQIYLDSLEKKVAFTGQFRVKNHNGEYSWLLAKGAVRTRPDGSFAGHISSSVDITEQVRILDQVRDSELDLRNIVLKAPIGICILDAATLVAEIVNNSFVEVAGRSYDAIAGKYYWDAFAEARIYYEEALAGVAREGKTYYADEVELMLVRHGAPEKVYVTFVYAPVLDLGGNVKKVAIWVHENTTQVATRRRLQEAEKKATLAIDSADLGVYEIDYASDTMLTDRRFKAIWGVDDPSFTRSDYVRYIHPDDRRGREIAHQRSLKTGQLDYHARILWPDGSAHWARITGTVIYDEQSQPTKLIGVAQDITEAVRIQKKIEDSEKRIRTMILQAPVAMCIFRGPAYQVSIANPKMIELWGKQPHDVLERPLFEGLPEAKDQGLEALLHHVYTTDETFTAHERPILLPRNGKTETIYIDFVYQSLTQTDSHEKDILAVAIDVTYQVIARQKIEELVSERTKDLAAANEQLHQSNAELSQFAYIASHDLQEPIRKIATYAGLLEEQPNTPPAAKNYLDKIISASIRMQALIRGVLSYSELSRTAPGFEAINLDLILAGVLTEFDLLIEQKQARIRHEPLPTIEAIPFQMTQLFSNLISNALKYSRPETSPVIDITCRIEDDHYHIDITDNGIGFAKEHAEHIFSIFKRLHRKNDYSGTGIGLAICKRIVENHHWRISASSHPGEGATFHLVLPIRGQHQVC